MKKKISFFEIKKYLNKKGFIVKKKNTIKTHESGLDNLSRTFLSSVIIISIFFIAPLAINLTKEKTIFSKEKKKNLVLSEFVNIIRNIQKKFANI